MSPCNEPRSKEHERACGWPRVTRATSPWPSASVGVAASQGDLYGESGCVGSEELVLACLGDRGFPATLRPGRLGAVRVGAKRAGVQGPAVGAGVVRHLARGALLQ